MEYPLSLAGPALGSLAKSCFWPARNAAQVCSMPCDRLRMVLHERGIKLRLGDQRTELTFGRQTSRAPETTSPPLWSALSCWGRFPERSRSAATWPMSPDLQPAARRPDRSWSIGRFAGPDCCNLIRCGRASCEVGTPGRVAGVSESATVQDERRPRTSEAPANIAGYALPEAAAADSRFASCDEVSMPRCRVGHCSILLIIRKIACVCQIRE